MLEVRGVVHTRGQHHDGGLGDAQGAAARAARPAGARVLLDRAQPVAGEQIRAHVRQRAAVLQHVGDPGRAAQVVLQHPEGALVVAHQVDAGDVDAHAVRRAEPVGLAMEVRRRW